MKTQLLQDFDESGSAAERPLTPVRSSMQPAADDAAAAAAHHASEAPDAPDARAAQSRPDFGPPPPSVWHRPQMAVATGQSGARPGQSLQHAAAGTMGGMVQDRAAFGRMRPPGGQGAQARQSRRRTPEGLVSGMRPMTPEDRAAAAAAGASARAAARAQARGAAPRRAEPGQFAGPAGAPSAAADMPDWLNERLREDAEQEQLRQRSRLATRRALGWSAAVTVAAMVAVAAYWVYQDKRVEGALDVVANTSPAAPAASAPVLPAAPAPASTPSISPVTSAKAADATAPAPDAGLSPAVETPLPAAPPSVAKDEVARGNSVPAPARAKAADAQATVPDKIDAPLRSPKAAAHRKPGSAETHVTAAAHAASGAASRERREETLMQCRVLGYDARECTRRRCMMTRFGLACPG